MDSRGEIPYELDKDEMQIGLRVIINNNSVISNFLNFSFVTNPFLNNICNYSIKKGYEKGHFGSKV